MVGEHSTEGEFSKFMARGKVTRIIMENPGEIAELLGNYASSCIMYTSRCIMYSVSDCQSDVFEVNFGNFQK